MTDLSAYYLDNYGMCARGQDCQCRRSGWLGRTCPDWQTFGAKNPDELGRAQAAFIRGRK